MCGIFREPKDTGLRRSKVNTGFPCVLSHGTPSEMVTSGACGLERPPWEERASFLLRPHPCRQAWPLRLRASPHPAWVCVPLGAGLVSLSLRLSARESKLQVSFRPASPGALPKEGGRPGCVSPAHGARSPVENSETELHGPPFMPSLGLRAEGGDRTQVTKRSLPVPVPRLSTDIQQEINYKSGT